MRVLLDENLPVELALELVIVRAPSNRLVHLRPLVPAILAALRDLQPGEARRVGA